MRIPLFNAVFLRVVASHHEGEWRCTPPRSKEGRALRGGGVRLATSSKKRCQTNASVQISHRSLVLAIGRRAGVSSRISVGNLVDTTHCQAGAEPSHERHMPSAARYALEKLF